MRIAQFLSVLVLFSTALSAQTTQKIVYHPNNSPTSGNAFPFGSEGIRYQSIVPGSLLGKVATIRDLFVYGRGDKDVVYEDIEIRMGVTKVAPASITTTWTTNNPKPTTVYRGPLRINFKSNKWTAIGLPKAYLYLGPNTGDNLCFEVIVWSAKTMITGSSSNFYYPGSSSARRAFQYRWTTTKPTTARTGSSACSLGILLNNGNFVVAGRGCDSSAKTENVISGSTWPQAGKNLTVSLSGGAATKVSYLSLGVKFQPFDMLPMGAPKCHVWFAPVVSAGTVSNAQGGASFTAKLPTSSTAGTVFAQWYQLDKTANAAGLTTSNYATIILGN